MYFKNYFYKLFSVFNKYKLDLLNLPSVMRDSPARGALLDIRSGANTVVVVVVVKSLFWCCCFIQDISLRQNET